ncbi:hypothetical protein Asi02nite_47900 [Asanoa siamensis]|uniref:Tetratricopeptide repeat protein n=2 Tax=Asanoa siamensis TaxID=926357 RepID=A0ABQ4CVF2_9ACTN|nr:hypothetical protein Asi02nite_47900 [Asanoa siamensis]
MPDTVSHETVGSILRGEALVRWSKVECVVRQLAAMAVHRPDPDDEVRRFHVLWTAEFDSQTADPMPPRQFDPIAASVIDAGRARATSDFPSPTTAQSVVGANGGRSIGMAPQRNRGFTGRRELLEQVRSKLGEQPWKPLVLHGLGGVGKSQLALEFLHRYARDYEFVWWITAEDPSQVTPALATLGERLDWQSSFDMAQTVRSVLARLETGVPRWLIVYDNAGAPDEIRSLAPQGGGHLLITTRDPAWLAIGRPVEVDVFTRPESVELLCARGHDIGFAEADQLAERLGDLPLALEQVAAMQSATRTPVEEYFRQLDDRALQFLESMPLGDYRTAIGTAFVVAVERLNEESPTAAALLSLLSCVGAEPISRTLLRSGAHRVPPPLGRLLDQPDLLDETIWQLRRYGLVRVVDNGQTLQVHRLIQAIVREAMSVEERAGAYANARLLLAAANPGRPREPLTWDMYARIGPHLRAARMVEAIERDARQVLIDHATYLSEIGDFEGSRRLSEEALEAWAPGAADDVQVVTCLRRLVAALFALGRHGEAYRRAEEARMRLIDHPDYGRDHPATLELSDVLAVLQRVFGRYSEALSRDREIVEGYRRTRGDNHPETLAARNNLAASLRAVGDFRAAQEIDEVLVKTRRELLSSDHQQTLLSVSNLARDLYGIGDYAAALDLQRSTCSAYRSRLGDRHPLVLAAWRTIVQGLRKTGQYGPAIEEGQRLFVVAQTHLGADHELTLATMMTYANTLRAAGDVYLASNHAADAVDRYRRTYGEHNPLTLAAATNQAIVLRAVGERRLARRVGEASLSALRQVLGPDHPYAILAATGVGNDLTLAGEHEIARRLLARTLEDAKRMCGDRHPDTLACGVNLGLLLPSDQPALLEASIDGLRRSLGARHPVVEAAMAGRPVECEIEPPPV